MHTNDAMSNLSYKPLVMMRKKVGSFNATVSGP